MHRWFEGPSAKLGHWRKARKARTSSMISQYHPPPPIETVGGGGRISREICRFFALRAIIWRRGSNFPRKMQVLGSFAIIRGRGRPRLLLLILPAVYGFCAAAIWESDPGRVVLASFASLTSRWQSTRRSNVRMQTDLGPAGHLLCHTATVSEMILRG